MLLYQLLYVCVYVHPLSLTIRLKTINARNPPIISICSEKKSNIHKITLILYGCALYKKGGDCCYNKAVASVFTPQPLWGFIWK